jgi:hypothetical protein
MSTDRELLESEREEFLVWRKSRYSVHQLPPTVLEFEAWLAGKRRDRRGRVTDRSWTNVKDQPPSKGEPIVYCRPARGGRFHVGIAYWTVSERWNPEMESQFAPDGFTHWMPLPAAPELGG